MIQERVLYTYQVMHVTFTIEEVGCWYRVFTETKEDGKHSIFDTENEGIAWYCADWEIALLEMKIEKRRAGYPTPKQLHFLFREKISIPPNLTWGEASDLIDQCLAQKQLKKQQSQVDRFNGFQVGMRVRQKNYDGIVGEITKLTAGKGTKFAYIQVDKDADFLTKMGIPFPGDATLKVNIETLVVCK